MQRPNYRYTPGLLSRLSGVPKATIVNWLIGRVARPRRWQDLVLVASALRLNEAEVDLLLGVAGHPPTATLRGQIEDPAEHKLLQTWFRDDTGLPIATRPVALAPAVLPNPTSPLIGREAEQARATILLTNSDVRLVTLTGPAGVGKTRLAMQIALDLQQFYADGVYFITLTAISDPDMLIPTITHTLGMSESGQQPLARRLGEVLRKRHVLLILDNCEHLLAASPTISELLATAPWLTVLVTSRVVLHIAGEHELALPLLDLPNLANLPPPKQLAEYSAIKLFLARVAAIKPDFQLTPANAAAVATICVRLDGLPLALELAAARSKLLPPHELLARLDQRLSLLTVAYTDRSSHQQTLRSTLDWSYRLLPASAQRIFIRLAIFVGGWSLHAAEAICSDSDSAGDLTQHQEILDGLMTLTDHSLVQTISQHNQQRYTLLETMRAYTSERLSTNGEHAIIAARHAAYYGQLARDAGAELSGEQQIEWLARLEQEHDNLRAALNWGLQHKPELAGQIATSIWRFWLLRGYLREGQHWLDQIAARVSAPTRAAALLGAGRLARQQGDLEAAAERLAASLVIQRTLHDQQGIAVALGYLGVVAYDQGDFVRAEALHRESLALREKVGDAWGYAATLINLGEVARQRGDLVAAKQLQCGALERFQKLGERDGIATALLNLGMIELALASYQTALHLLQESLALWVIIGEQVDIAECFEGLAAIAATTSAPQRAAQLAGAAAGVRELAGSLLSPADQQRVAGYIAHIRAELGPAAFQIAWNEGRALRLADAIAIAQALSVP
jgi:non-specific serine/threonine protein kinase